MNLIEDAWIPVQYKNSSYELISLYLLFCDAEKISDLCVNPPQRIALTRMLICITQAALDGPADMDEWFDCKNKIICSVKKYLDEQKNRFNLYDVNYPFLQVKNLTHSCNATLDKLDFGLSSGNNPTVFDNFAIPEGRQHPDSWIALRLLTYQCFSPGGLIGTTSWNGQETGKNSEHAPSIESSPLHTIIRGKGLLETIYLNLLTKEDIKTFPNCIWGPPIWENPPEQQENNEHLTLSYPGRLVPMSRAIKLEKGNLKFTLANGLIYPKFPKFREPAVTVIKKKDGNGYLNIDIHKHPWRELGSILAIKDDNISSSPICLKKFAEIANRNESFTCDIWTGGIVADKAKLIDSAEWNFSFPINLMTATVLSNYKKGVEYADNAQKSLCSGVKTYCNFLSNAQKSLYSGVKTYCDFLSNAQKSLLSKAKTCYWTKLDGQYKILLELCVSEELNSGEWRKIIFAALEKAFYYACPHTTSIQIEAFAQGKKHLYPKKKMEI